MRLFSATLILAFIFLSSFGVARAAIREMPLISVMAPSALTVPFTEIVRRYTSLHNININVSYDSSDEHARRLQQGTNTDIFISSRPATIRKLQEMGIIGKKQTYNWLTTELVVMAGRNSRLTDLPRKEDFRETLGLISNRSILVIGDPDVTPLGSYTREALQNTGLWRKIAPLAVKAANSRMVLYLISQENMAGIGYYTDAYHNPEVTILARIPPSYHAPISFQIALVRWNPEKTEVQSFIRYLLDDSSVKQTLLNYGFTITEEE